MPKPLTSSINSLIFAANKLKVKATYSIVKFLVLILLHLNLTLVSQIDVKIKKGKSNFVPMLLPLSESDSLALVHLPILDYQNILIKSKELPAELDNSTQVFFRPMFEQVSNECGQYASIGLTFTYELNYSRNTIPDVPENQFPTHYTYNFMNGGFGWYGASYFHSFEIAKVNGHPSVADFGALNECGPSFWMSGYDKYQKGMSNKIDEVYQIPVGTEEGLLVLKNWLHNHLEGKEVGGIACFYSATPWNITTLPQDTPEGGKYVITDFKKSATHSSTITGYNDSIRYDYNQDGQFTNHIDINNDGAVNMKDWEIGGLKFTDSYLDGVNWADSGFCYMMYKTLADKLGEGGIWNHVVHVVKIKEDYSPKVSLKLNLAHNCREKIKVMAGLSNHAGDDFPEFTMGFPIFDFQGGCQHMGGGFEPGALALELGLDITPLLGRINTNQEVAFYLMVYENDPNNQGSGQIINFSIVDHMDNDHEYTYPSTNLPILENGMTFLKITADLDFNKLRITTDNLPIALTGELYSQQLSAQGGTTPYTWNFVESFSEYTLQSPFPEVSAEKLEFPDTIHSQVLKPLEFQFPFYGEQYDSIWIHTDGFIMFDDQIYPWPYMYDEHLMIKKTRNISPFLNGYLYVNEDEDDGVWYEGNDTYAAFRWKMSSKFPAGLKYEFSLVIYETGNMEFHYKQNDFLYNNSWAAGLSKGDEVSYQYATNSVVGSNNSDEAISLIPREFPHELSISPEGLITGIPLKNYTAVDLLIDVVDKNLLNQRKLLKFHSYVAGVHENESSILDEVRVYPNPTSGKLWTDFNLMEKANLSVEVYSAAGKILYQSPPTPYTSGKHSVFINLDNLTETADGMIFMRIITNEKISHIEKLTLIK